MRYGRCCSPPTPSLQLATATAASDASADPKARGSSFSFSIPSTVVGFVLLHFTKEPRIGNNEDEDGDPTFTAWFGGRYES